MKMEQSRHKAQSKVGKFPYQKETISSPKVFLMGDKSGGTRAAGLTWGSPTLKALGYFTINKNYMR